jgi:purine nucleosidase
MDQLRRVPIFIDSDLAMGSPFGDVDDAFAIAALFKSKCDVAGMASVFGNTSEPRAYANLSKIAARVGYSGRVLRGSSRARDLESEASRAMSDLRSPTRVLALGPLTNLARTIQNGDGELNNIYDVTFVGTNRHHRLPAWRVFDFNASQDLGALKTLIYSTIRLHCVPCDVARRLRVRALDLEGLSGDLGEFLRRGSRRWFWRSYLLKGMRSIPVWDLTAAMYLIRPDLFVTEDTGVTIGRCGEARFAPGKGRAIRVVADFEPAAVWGAFLKLFL